jgi:hypothetical protein
MKKITCALASVIIASGCGVAMAQSNNGGGNNATRPGDTGQIGNPSQRITNGTPQGNGAQLYVSPAVVRQIKQGLNQAGYAAGDVNGTWDKKAAGAMKKFQEAQGLAPTGHINLTTLNVLGVNVQTALSGGNGNGANGNGANGAMTTGSINGNGGANGANGGANGINGGVNGGMNGASPGGGANGGGGGANVNGGVPQLNGNQ